MNELTPEEKLKGALIFRYLQTGKLPKRKNLFRILFYLAQESYNFSGINMTSSSVTLKRPSFDRTVEIKVKVKANVDNLKDILNKYLVNYELKFLSDGRPYGFLTIYYSSQNIQWALIDEELRVNHANNIKEMLGFPRIINYYEKQNRTS
jgi:hypothetical protein